MGKLSFKSSGNVHKPKLNKKYITTKGIMEELHKNEEQLKNYLTHMKKISETNLRSLAPSDKEIFDKLRDYVSVIYTNEAMYADFKSSVSEIFCDVSVIIPGTVGAFFYGSEVKTSFDHKFSGCSLLSAGSIPSANSEIAPCPHLVIMAIWKGEKNSYEFTMMNKEAPITDKAILFVDATKYSDDNSGGVVFKGLSMREKRNLQNNSIKSVKIVGYECSFTKYHSLLPEALDVDEIKTRDETASITHNTQENYPIVPVENMNNMGFAIPIVLIIIVIILVMVKRRQ